ncbi:putative alpha-1,6-mannanase (GH76 family) [Paenibacillus castaneae]|uniref:glycoside hydrolase family 76 protein n=1 Tax=Paenibacillus castaneae TaxID=474957 RepID=UPI000C9BFB06|nr:glycoside hydrolase family 76 protein [Paenibacillus castaneae]NIK75293.1 putative alpha-1,6-mannanase (GH76 family) [Paenibacillus castaneae]
MKRMCILLVGSILLSGCSDNGSKKENYSIHAEWAEEMFIKHYWNENGKLIHNAYPYSKEREGNLNYWWKAHAVDAMMDGYDRTGDEQYARKAEDIVKSIIKLNGSLFNEFYDDMEWLALAALRLYDATESETVKNYVIKLWGDIKTAWWEDELGGLAWKKDQRQSRNACSNGPAAILAARLYERFGSEEDLEWSKKIFAWQKEHLVDPETGNVYDGLELKADGTIDVNKNWIFTYNQGTYIGAAVELYKQTGDKGYLADAEKTAAAALAYHVHEGTGMMKEEGTGDGGLFKGILIRYLTQLYEVNKDSKIKEMIDHNADVLLSKGSTQEEGLFGTAWDKPHQEPLDLSVQLSGVFLLEAAAKIEKGDKK